MVEIRHYRDLVIWQKAMDLVEEIYLLTKALPREETYALTDQMRRAAISLPSNITEGHARKTKKEFVQFLTVARGSKAELQTQLLICERLRYLDSEQTLKAFELSEEIGKMLGSLIRSLSDS